MKKGNNLMEDLITLKEAAKALKVEESTLRTWKSRNVIPEECFLKLGTKVYLRRDRFKTFIDN